jgi:aminoglycoside 6'-N-acetyltransferase I
MNIRPCTHADQPGWLRMRRALWPELATEDEAAAAAEWRGRPDAMVLVAERPDGAGLAGFAEVGSRPYADGCSTSPVAYLEGWFVDADVRRTGVGAALICAVEAWARAQGYTELASDALLGNIVSQHAHEALGFRAVDRVVQYRKPL